jgi:hypothetical protein
MLPVGHDDEPLDAFAYDEAGEFPGLAPGSEGSAEDPLARRAVGANVDEEVTEPGLCRRHQIYEPAVARKAQVRNAPPFEASHAQHEAVRRALPEKAQAEALSRLATGEDEDQVRLSVGHFDRMIAWG